jgi:hypothetical protein
MSRKSFAVGTGAMALRPLVDIVGDEWTVGDDDDDEVLNDLAALF